MSNFLQALHHQPVTRLPVWFMRQAGRYLPEYQKVRATFPDFIQFCLTPDAATQVTLQPVTRFDVDAAIIFADILTIPHALGHTVTFSTGYGPHVEPITTTAQITQLANRLENIVSLSPVAQTVAQTRKALPKSKAVIGFCGGPFTLACYMLDAKPSQGIPNTLKMIAEHPRSFTRLLDTLTAACATYLSMQIQAGADAVQVFESWASACPAEHWKAYIHTPLITLSKAVKLQHPATPVLLFPRLATNAQLLALRNAAPNTFNALSLSTETDLAWAAQTLQPQVTIQGNLDPMLFTKATPAPLQNALNQSLSLCGNQPGYIVNLGHGFTPETNPDFVKYTVETIHAFQPAKS
ncbi:MAG: uroporphyrinogen decarboxylase [Alphaproteobacteria bacterium]